MGNRVFIAAVVALLARAGVAEAQNERIVWGRSAPSVAHAGLAFETAPSRVLFLLRRQLYPYWNGYVTDYTERRVVIPPSYYAAPGGSSRAGIGSPTRASVVIIMSPYSYYSPYAYYAPYSYYSPYSSYYGYNGYYGPRHVRRHTPLFALRPDPR